MLRGENGITLVALIITIIVLIILAAVTIITFTDSGLLNTAVEGTQNYANAQETEKNIMENLDNHVNKILQNIDAIQSGIKG